MSNGLMYLFLNQAIAMHDRSMDDHHKPTPVDNSASVPRRLEQTALATLTLFSFMFVIAAAAGWGSQILTGIGV